MRIVIFACVLLWSGFTAGKLYSAPKVIMSAKLQGTLAGSIVQRRLEVYVGRTVEFAVRHQGTNFLYSGKIEQIIVPDIADYISTGHQGKARFKAKFSDVQPKDKQDNDIRLPEAIDFKNVLLREDTFPSVGYMQYLDADALLGGDYQLVRLLARYTNDSGETFWEALVELAQDPETPHKKREIEPFVVLLNEKEDFMKIVAY